MAHEIYYTSTAKGLKPGSRGLATVAASENIPPALWERLESLSAYRHPFEPEDPRNPVAWAHWILYIGGREHNVLSRICDNGFDYTRRSNVFAHHVALAPEDRAAAGPAWMMARGGTMASQWDGRVGPIHRNTRLPRGDSSAGRCATWQSVAGDAGWAGVLVGAFVDRPTRPACIIYSPEQAPHMLALMGEAIALLPAGQRWNVTFHTYFTSMPGNVQCLWRCCLAGSPAAITARSSAGLVLDLSRLDALGDLPDTPWVERARGGRPVESAPEPSATVARLGNRTFDRKKSAPPPIPLAEEQPGPLQPDVPIGRPMHVPRVLWSDDPSRRDRDPHAKSRWWNMLLLYLLACGAVAVGVWLLALSNRSVPAPPPSIRTDSPTPSNPSTQTVSVDPPATRNTQPIAINSTTRSEVVISQPPVTRPTTVQVASTRPRNPLTMLGQELTRMQAGGGMGTKPQVIAVPAEAIDDVARARRLGILFPGGQESYSYRDANVQGNITSQDDSTAEGPGLSLQWKDTSGGGTSVKVLTMRLEKGPQLRVVWNVAMLRRPDLQVAAYWVVQGSQMVVGSAEGQSLGRFNFKSVAPEPVKLLGDSPMISLPCELPGGAILRMTNPLPEGWTASCEQEWDAKNAATKPPELAIQTIRMKWERVADAGFNVSIPPGWSRVETDLASRRMALASTVEKSKTDLAAVEAEIAQANADARADMSPLETQILEFQAMKKKSAAEMQAAGVTVVYLNRVIAQAHQQIQQRRSRLEAQLAEIEPRKTQFEQAKTEAQQVLDALTKLSEFDLDVELADGLRVARIRFDTKAP